MLRARTRHKTVDGGKTSIKKLLHRQTLLDFEVDLVKIRDDKLWLEQF